MLHSILYTQWKVQLRVGRNLHRDKTAAENFAKAATECGVKRIIYLSGLSHGKDEDLSEHLRSRNQVGEILKLKIKDIAFKVVENKQYAEVVVNGKTGTRSLPLIDSIPYLKDYLDHEHPQPGNPNAVLICGIGKSLGRAIGILALSHIYRHYKIDLFPKLLESPNVAAEVKQTIRELLKKPWNPYLNGRHTSLTRKSKILKEATLRVFAGWTTGSNMPQRYIHHFGNAACESILEAYGIVTKDQQLADVLKSKQCPNCNEPNKPDSRFCAKCRMVLTYDAYKETADNKLEKEDVIATLSDQLMKVMQEIEILKKQK